MGNARRVVHGRTPVVVGVGLLTFNAGWLIFGITHPVPYPVVGWFAPPAMALLAAHMCWGAAAKFPVSSPEGRFWRHIFAATLLLSMAAVSNAYDALSGPVPSQRIGPFSLACDMTILAIVIWSLLRLPAWQRSVGDWARFALDASIILVSGVLFAWHFSVSQFAAWTAQTGSALPVIAIIVVGLVSMVAFVKVAFAGVGDLNRRSLQMMSWTCALSAAGGATSPFLVDRPYISSSMLAMPLAALGVQLAAYRQVREDVRPRSAEPERKFSFLPYFAVAATDLLLILEASRIAPALLLLAVGAVALTALVMTRQITALVDNQRLLSTVDSNLADLQTYQEKLVYQANHDPLTNVPNRSLLVAEIDRVLGAGGQCCVVLMDLDNFKAINDRNGHIVGDQLLAEASGRLATLAGDAATVARLGGDEFVLLVPGAGQDRVNALMHDALDSLQQPFHIRGKELINTVSIGATTSTPEDSSTDMLRRADVAMYAAKNSGGGRSAWFDPEMDARANDDNQLAEDLRHAISDNELHMVYQPIVNLADGTINGVEALVRWRHPHRGFIPPDRFIPIAERDGQIINLGAWVISTVLQQASQWKKIFGKIPLQKISVNVSARQLTEPDFAHEIAAQLARLDLDPRVIVIEVTETAVFNGGPALVALHQLHSMGVRIALDDFGTGHSSLSLLLDCPVDIIKVDKSFVHNLTKPGPQAAIIDGIIAITRRLGIKAVAEGVENDDQAHDLACRGYELAQGYLLARPMESEP